MKQFTLLPDAANVLRKTLLSRLLFMTGIVIIAVFIVPMVLSGEFSVDLSTGITLVIIAVMLAITYKLGLQRAKRMLSTYRLTIAEDSITREISNMPTLTLRVDEIQKISRNADGSYTIKGNSALNAIGIPSGVEGREELELMLAAIMPLTITSNTTIWLRYQYLIILLVVGFMYGSYMVENKYLATFMGVVFISMMCYSWIVQQRSKNVSKRVRMFSYLMIIPVISVIMRLITLWTA